MLNQKQLADKVKSYEAFVTNVLQVDLAKASNVKAKLQSELQELQDLEHNLKVLQQSGQQSIKTQVDVGSEVLCSAHIPDVSRVYISIGLGFHLEATLEEAPRIIGIRKANVEKKSKPHLIRVHASGRT